MYTCYVAIKYKRALTHTYTHCALHLAVSH